MICFIKYVYLGFLLPGISLIFFLIMVILFLCWSLYTTFWWPYQSHPNNYFYHNQKIMRVPYYQRAISTYITPTPYKLHTKHLWRTFSEILNGWGWGDVLVISVSRDAFEWTISDATSTTLNVKWSTRQG